MNVFRSHIEARARRQHVADMHPTQITKKEAPLDVWAAEALNEFARLGLKAPTLQEVKDAYSLGESPQTWAAYVAGQDALEETRK